jgi:hypothetical protein
MNAVDTNVLIYSHDPRDPAKQAVALSLIGSLTDGLLRELTHLDPLVLRLETAFQT